MNFLAELSMMHYVTVSSYSPSMIVASAVYAARCTTDSDISMREEGSTHSNDETEPLRSNVDVDPEPLNLADKLHQRSSAAKKLD